MKNRGNISISGLENINQQPTVTVRIENGNVWLTKHEIANLFGVLVQTVDANLRIIFKSGLLYDNNVSVTERQETSKGIHYVTFYNLEVVIFLSFRIGTYCTKLFRKWVLNALCEYKRLKERRPEVFIIFNATDNKTTVSYN